MKRSLLKKFLMMGFLSLVVSGAFAQANLLIDNFEGGNKGWVAVETWCGIAANPAPGGINTSDSVLATVRGTANDFWSGAILNPPALAGTPITGYKYLHAKMYRTNMGQPRLKVNDSSGGDIAPMSNIVIAANVWQDVVFDISQAAGVNFIMFMADYTVPMSTSDVTLYIDDVTLSNDPTPITANTVGGQNLIQGGDMESATPWIQVGGTDAGDNSQLVWGDVPNDARPQSYHPEGFGTGGFFTFAVNWGAAQYFMAQQVSVTANTTYTFSFDYNIGDYSKAWLQVYMGATDPTTVTDYQDNQFGDIIPWGEFVGATGDGHFSKDTTFTANATFYVVIKMGCGWAGARNEGYLNLSLDNVSLVANSGMGIKNVDLTANKAVVVGEKSSISATFEGTAAVTVYSIQGQIIRKSIAQNTFEAGNLPSGIYLVTIGNKTYKAIVQ
jgi:hypothetical protein